MSVKCKILGTNTFTEWPIKLHFIFQNLFAVTFEIYLLLLLLLLLLSLLQALQLQRSFSLFNEFLPFGPVTDAFLPIFYFHLCYVALYIVFPSIFRSS